MSDVHMYLTPSTSDLGPFATIQEALNSATAPGNYEIVCDSGYTGETDDVEGIANARVEILGGNVSFGGGLTINGEISLGSAATVSQVSYVTSEKDDIDLASKAKINATGDIFAKDKGDITLGNSATMSAGSSIIASGAIDMGDNAKMSAGSSIVASSGGIQVGSGAVVSAAYVIDAVDGEDGDITLVSCGTMIAGNTIGATGDIVLGSSAMMSAGSGIFANSGIQIGSDAMMSAGSMIIASSSIEIGGDATMIADGTIGAGGNIEVLAGAKVFVNATDPGDGFTGIMLGGGADLYASSSIIASGRIEINGDNAKMSAGSSIIASSGGILVSGSDATMSAGSSIVASSGGIQVGSGAVVSAAYDIDAVGGVDGDITLVSCGTMIAGSTIGATGDIVLGSSAIMSAGSGILASCGIQVGSDATMIGGSTIGACGDIELGAGATVTGGRVSADGSIEVEKTSLISFGTDIFAASFVVNKGTDPEGCNLLLDYTGSGSHDVDYYKTNLHISGENDLFAQGYLRVINSDVYYAPTAYISTKYTSSVWDIKGSLANGINAYSSVDSVRGGTWQKIVCNNATSRVAFQGGTNNFIEANSFYGTDSNTFSQMVIGGYDFTTSSHDTSAEFESSLTVESGTFNKAFCGGDCVSVGDFNHIGDVSLTINGGTFKTYVIGGGVYMGSDDPANNMDDYQIDGSINFTITGGEFKNKVIGGNLATKGTPNATAKTHVTDDITMNLDVSGITVASTPAKTIHFENNVIAGSYGAGHVSGDTHVNIIGHGDTDVNDGNYLIFDAGCRLVGDSGSGSIHAYANGKKEYTQSYVGGTKNLSFTGYNGTFNAGIYGFDNIVLSDSRIELTNASRSVLDTVENWDLGAGSCLDFGSCTNDFEGDALNLAAWSSAVDWKVFSGGSAAAFNGFADFDSVTLGGEVASLDETTGEFWASDHYKLYLSGNDMYLKNTTLA